MSRSGYTDDCDNQWGLIRWRGAVAKATGGARGQALLREILEALDAMPVKSLVAESLVTQEGDFCTLGALGQKKGIPIDRLDAEDWDAVAKAFGVAPALVREIVYENDEVVSDFKYDEVEICGPVRPHWPEYGRHKLTIHVPDPDAGHKRWLHMRNWVASQIKQEKAK